MLCVNCIIRSVAGVQCMCVCVLGLIVTNKLRTQQTDNMICELGILQNRTHMYTAELHAHRKVLRCHLQPDSAFRWLRYYYHSYANISLRWHGNIRSLAGASHRRCVTRCYSVRIACMLFCAQSSPNFTTHTHTHSQHRHVVQWFTPSNVRECATSFCLELMASFGVIKARTHRQGKSSSVQILLWTSMRLMGSAQFIALGGRVCKIAADRNTAHKTGVFSNMHTNPIKPAHAHLDLKHNKRHACTQAIAITSIANILYIKCFN